MKRLGLCRATLVLMLAVTGASRADHLSQRTQEVRTLLYYHAAPDALAAALPAGWIPVDATAGAAAGANLTVNISQQIITVGATGAPTGEARGQGVTISARVRDPQTGEARAMVLFGLTNGEDAPGPYGLHHAAAIAMARSEQSNTGAAMLIEEHWDAVTPDGDEVSLDLAYRRGPVTMVHVDQQTRSAAHPMFYRIYKIDMVQDSVRDRATRQDIRVAGVPAKLLAGAELKAIVSVPVYRREIWLPDKTE